MDTPDVSNQNSVESVKPKTRAVRKDALFFSGLVLDKRFNMSVRYVDWVDLNAAAAETFSGAYILHGPIEINPNKARVLLVKAAYGSITNRKPWVQVMVLQPSGYISKTKIYADASRDGWELEIRDRVLSLLRRVNQGPAVSQRDTDKSHDKPHDKPHNKPDEEPASCPEPIKPGSPVEIVCSRRLADLCAKMSDRTPQAIIDYALHQVSIEDYLDE